MAETIMYHFWHCYKKTRAFILDISLPFYFSHSWITHLWRRQPLPYREAQGTKCWEPQSNNHQGTEVWKQLRKDLEVDSLVLRKPWDECRQLHSCEKPTARTIRLKSLPDSKPSEIMWDKNFCYKLLCLGQTNAGKKNT